MLGLIALGCSDDGTENPPKPDKGVVTKKDGQVTKKDGQVTKKDGQVTQKDGGGVPSGCEAKCFNEWPFYCVTDTSTGSCVQCTSDAHCTANPNAWGTKCNKTAGYCTCSSSSDCTKKTSGKVCHSSAQVCSCAKDTDCQTGYKCIESIGSGIKVCRIPCKNDSYCTGNKSYPYCDTKTGLCAECKTSANCTSGYTWGNNCIDNTTYGKQCRCSSNADCKNNPNGPTCYSTYKKCSCAKDADCTNKTYPKCSPPYKGATYNNCQKACTTSKDCDSTLKCLTSLKKCGECAADTDCTSSTAKFCDTATNKCMACKADKDCTSATSPFCVTGKCVACKTNTDCAKSMEGGACVSGSCACKADTDCKGANVWGPKCTKSTSTATSGVCRCSANTDCKNNPNGPTCYTTYKKCSCKDNTECKNATYQLCDVPYSGASYKHCQKKCTADTDCATGTVCQKSSGKCVTCLTNAHCGYNVPICDTTTNKCIGCKANADCKDNIDGAVCDTKTQKCVCKANTDCASKSSWGPTCKKSSSTATTGLCRCKANTDCSGNLNGPTCYTTYGKCSCKADTDCKDATRKKCFAPYGGATYSRCQKACSTKADCPAYLSFKSCTTGACK